MHDDPNLLIYLSPSHQMSICLFSVSVSLFLLQIGLSVLFFLDSNICVNTQYLFFSFWLTSLYITFSRSLHGSANDTIYSFLWLSNIPLYVRVCVCVCVCMCVPLCVYVIFHCGYAAAAAAKSLQPCPTLRSPIDGSPLSLWFSRQEYWSGLPFPFLMHACMLSRFSHVRLCVTLWPAAHQAPLSTGFSRQEYWSGLPCPSPSLIILNLNITLCKYE